jgi:Domain of unknown function (DUF397)
MSPKHVNNANTELGADGWRKPWSGTNGGNCVEAKRITDGLVALRNSTDPTGAALLFTTEDVAAFINGAKAGDADFLVGEMSLDL